MDARSRLAFLALVLTQAAHSVEEYVFKLNDVFTLSRYVSGLLSNDPATGFIIFSVALILFGLWCYLGPVRNGHRSARIWVWVWIIMQMVNGIGHLIISLVQGAYFPGAATAPLLLIIAVYLWLKVGRVLPLQRSCQG